MRYALFTIPRPIGSVGEWRPFFDSVDAKLKPHQPHFARIAETVWLVDNQSAPAALAWLIATAETRKVAYAIASFECPPEWLTAGFDPRTNQA